MAGNTSFTTAQYADSATRYRSELIHLPLLALSEVFPYMTVRPGIRGKEVVGESQFNAELAPYVAGRRKNVNLDIIPRVLETFFGKVNADFDPSVAISTIFGHRASQSIGDAQKTTIQAKEVLALMAKSVGQALYNSLWTAERDATGETTHTLFNGFDTITETEKTAGNIAAGKGNYVQLSEAITKDNAVDLIQEEILYKLHPLLRREDAFMFCSQEIADLYNKNYLMSHTGVVYNDKYNQVAVEGSANRLFIVPLANKADSKFIHISTKSNMLLGVDQMSDAETVKVGAYDPDFLTFSMAMFFGTEFESIDPRRLMVAELAV